MIKNLAWLGLFADEAIEAAGDKLSPLDLLTQAMLDRLQFQTLKKSPWGLTQPPNI